MRRHRLASLTAVAAAGVLLIPSAAAKSRVSLTLEPARPVAGKQARVIIRSDILLPRNHGIRLHAVGPWRRTLEQEFFEIRLARTAPRTLTGTVRFPYAGKWILNVPPPWASPALDQVVKVRPRA